MLFSGAIKDAHSITQGNVAAVSDLSTAVEEIPVRRQEFCLKIIVLLTGMARMK